MPGGRAMFWAVWALTSAGVAAQQPAAAAGCGAGPSVAATVFAVLLLLCLGALGFVLYLYVWKPRHCPGLEKISLGENGRDEGRYAFDNPYLVDDDDIGRKSTLPCDVVLSQNEKPDTSRSIDSKTSKKSPFSMFSAATRAGRRTADDSAVAEPQQLTVPLRSHDFTGLGFSICGNMREGIFIRDVAHHGPASESGQVKAGDRVTGLTVSFGQMVLHDALTILSYASPYAVQLHLEKDSASSARKISATQSSIPGHRLAHPLFRSQSVTSLTKPRWTNYPLESPERAKNTRKPNKNSSQKPDKNLASKSPSSIGKHASKPHQVEARKETMHHVQRDAAVSLSSSVSSDYREMAVDVPEHMVKSSPKQEVKVMPSPSKYSKLGVRVLPIAAVQRAEPAGIDVSPDGDGSRDDADHATGGGTEPRDPPRAMALGVPSLRLVARDGERSDVTGCLAKGANDAAGGARDSETCELRTPDGPQRVRMGTSSFKRQKNVERHSLESDLSEGAAEEKSDGLRRVSAAFGLLKDGGDIDISASLPGDSVIEPPQKETPKSANQGTPLVEELDTKTGVSDTHVNEKAGTLGMPTSPMNVEEVDSGNPLHDAIHGGNKGITWALGSQDVPPEGANEPIVDPGAVETAHVDGAGGDLHRRSSSSSSSSSSSQDGHRRADVALKIPAAVQLAGGAAQEDRRKRANRRSAASPTAPDRAAEDVAAVAAAAPVAGGASAAAAPGYGSTSAAGDGTEVVRAFSVHSRPVNEEKVKKVARSVTVHTEGVGDVRTKMDKLDAFKEVLSMTPSRPERRRSERRQEDDDVVCETIEKNTVSRSSESDSKLPRITGEVTGVVSVGSKKPATTGPIVVGVTESHAHSEHGSGVAVTTSENRDPSQSQNTGKQRPGLAPPVPPARRQISEEGERMCASTGDLSRLDRARPDSSSLERAVSLQLARPDPPLQCVSVAACEAPEMDLSQVGRPPVSGSWEVRPPLAAAGPRTVENGMDGTRPASSSSSSSSSSSDEEEAPAPSTGGGVGVRAGGATPAPAASASDADQVGATQSAGAAVLPSAVWDGRHIPADNVTATAAATAAPPESTSHPAQTTPTFTRRADAPPRPAPRPTPAPRGSPSSAEREQFQISSAELDEVLISHGSYLRREAERRALACRLAADDARSELGNGHHRPSQAHE